MSYQVAVCGPGRCGPQEERHAQRVGRLLARDGVVVLCGGGGGVMAAVAAGVRAEGGTVVGVLPDADRGGASPDLSVAVVTNMGQARNVVLVWSADAVIVVGGSWGTLSEVALARRRGAIPVVCLGGWRVTDAAGDPVAGMTHVDTPEEAVSVACAAIRR